MKLLLHICCAPCACYSVESLRKEKIEPVGFWFNPNIHPLVEYRKRREALKQLSEAWDLRWIDKDEYPLESWLAGALDNIEDRCSYCYRVRLEQTALAAKENGFSDFSTTLLYSRYQKHDRIIIEGEKAGEKHGVSFFYRDFRPGWSRGITLSKKLNLYRQQYCGCVFSEKERYENDASTPLSPNQS